MKMRTLHYLLAIAAVFGLSGVARASVISPFQMVVIDPPSYSVEVITTPTFTIDFAACVSPGQIPSGTSYVGCFTGQNGTAATFTSLSIFTPGITGCATSFGGGLDLFATEGCSSVAGGELLSYSGGTGIAAGALFTIAESGVDPTAFPESTGTVTPEPGSLWLLSTGALAAGLYMTRRRRSVLLQQS
jgi:hypothetical protein